MNDDARDSQQEPEQDSALQTPQPDQPHPPVSNRPSDAPADSPPVEVEVNVDVPAAPAEQTESD
jgi:hypothetical protein